MVTILHISDLHFTRNEAMHTMREVLKRQARERVHDKPRGEKLLVVTGDFHNFWVPDYADATKFMGELVEAMDIDPAQDVFVIPGNHDVADDKVLGPILKDKIPDWKMHKDAALMMIRSGNFKYLGWRMEAFVPYCTFARSLGLYPQVADPISDTSPARVHVRCWRDKLNILHLNTALVADGSAKDNQIADVTTATDPELWNAWYRDDLPVLALGHNSFFDLQKGQRDSLAALFAQRNVSAYLCGDTHKVELDPERQTINIGVGQMPIPNVVSAKGVADLSDDYSDFGYYWHEWDEGTDSVETRFYRWRSEYLAEVASEGISVRYRMRRKASRPKPGNGSGPSKAASAKGEEQDPDAELRDYLAGVLERKRKRHPSFQLLKVDEIDARLYPKVAGDDSQEYRQIPAQARISVGEGEDERCPVWEVVRESWSSADHRNVVIIGEGGIGKTVALFSITRSPEGMPIPALYIPMYELVDRDGKARELSEYVKASYSVYGAAIEKLATRPWKDRPRLLVLLDGFNEVPFALRRSLLHEVNDWYGYHPGVQLVAVSRPMDGLELSSELAGDPIAVTLFPLDDVTIGEYLEEAESDVPPRNSPIWENLRYPLFLNLYVKTGGLQEKKPAGYPLHVMESRSGGALIWNYLQRELLRHSDDARERAEEWVLRCAVANEYVLPYLAYQMVSVNSVDVSYDQVEDWTARALGQLDSGTLPGHLEKIWSIFRKNHGSYPKKDLYTSQDWLNTVLQDTGILVPVGRAHDERTEHRKDEVYVFMHQNFRDCLAGLHLVNQAEVERLPKEWGQTLSHLALKYVAEFMEQGDQSVLKGLWKANRVRQDYDESWGRINHIVTCNLLELCRFNKKLQGGLNFSGMDLCGLSLTRYLGRDGPALPLFRSRLLTKETKFNRSTFESEGHRDWVRCATILPDGRVVSGSDDRTLRVWDPVTGECLQTLGGHGYRVLCVAALTDGRVVSGSADGVIRVWDTYTGECLHSLAGHGGKVLCVVALPDGHVVSGSADRTLRVWDLSTGKCLCIFAGHKDEVKCATALSDGLVVSGSADRTLQVWDTSNGKRLNMLLGHADTVTCVTALPDGRVVSGSADRTLRAWNTSTGECLHTFGGHHRDWVLCVTSLPGGRVASGSVDRTLRVWDTSTGECLRTFEGHVGWVLCDAALPDSRVVSGSADRSLRVWDLSTGECLRTLVSHRGEIKCVAALPGGYVISGSTDGTLRVWDPSAGDCLRMIEGHEGEVRCVAILPDGYVVSGSTDGTLRVWDTSTGECRHTLEGYGGWVLCVAILPDGCVASGSADGALRVWDPTTGERLYMFEGNSGWVKCAVVLPDGHMVSGYADGMLSVWDLSTGECLRAFGGHENTITCMVALPDGGVLVGYDDGDLRAWDPSTGECLGMFGTHEDTITSVVVSPDGRVFAGSNDGNLREWDLSTEKCLKTFVGHTSMVTCLVALPDGRMVSGSDDGTLRVWDTSSSECLDVMETTEVDVSMMDFTLATLTPDLVPLLWRGGARISPNDYERYIKPHRKTHGSDE